MKHINMLLIAALCTVAVIGGVYAQTTTPVTVTAPTWFDNFVLPALATLATAVVTWLSAVANRTFNLQIEAKHREALETALVNGAALMAKHGINFAISYVFRMVPDALAKFGLSQEDVKLKLEAKTVIAATQSPPTV